MADNFGSNLKGTLQQHKNDKGVSLYDHLCNLLQVIDMPDMQYSAYPELENISYFIKANTFDYSKPAPDSEVNTVKEIDTMGIKAFCNKCEDFLKVTFFKLFKKNSPMEN